MRVVMALMWALGLSRRSVECVLTALGCPAYRVKVIGKAKLVGFVVDAKSGERLGIDMLVERDGE